MKWTEEKPTEPGWYWLKAFEDSIPEITHLDQMDIDEEFVHASKTIYLQSQSISHKTQATLA